LPLISKIQYKNYEPGEFTEEKERTYEDTIHLIESFPWNEQRDHLAIALTNPSVTMQGPNYYLKLAPYYHGKFVLYYFNARKQLYIQSFQHYQDTYPVIKSFFEDSPELSGFRLEASWFQPNIHHFKTRAFRYSLNPPLAISGALLMTILLLAYLTPFVGLLFLPSILHRLLDAVFLGLMGIVLFLLEALFINHYRAASKKVLIISRGKDLFYYGWEQQPEAFDKKEIRDVIAYGGRNSKGFSRLTRVEINFLDGRSIDISCLIISQVDLLAKFSRDKCRKNKVVFAFIPLSASAPS